MKKELLIGMAAACVALLFVACSGSKESTEQTEEETVQLVKVARVTEQAVPQVVSYTATIEPYKRNLISSSLPNRIKKIYVEVGDHVKAGQKLVDLDRANLAQQKLQLAQDFLDAKVFILAYCLQDAFQQGFLYLPAIQFYRPWRKYHLGCRTLFQDLFALRQNPVFGIFLYRGVKFCDGCSEFARRLQHQIAGLSRTQLQTELPAAVY